jgi:hypothetical protein
VCADQCSSLSVWRAFRVCLSEPDTVWHSWLCQSPLVTSGGSTPAASGSASCAHALCPAALRSLRVLVPVNVRTRCSCYAPYVLAFVQSPCPSSESALRCPTTWVSCSNAPHSGPARASLALHRTAARLHTCTPLRATGRFC